MAYTELYRWVDQKGFFHSHKKIRLFRVVCRLVSVQPLSEIHDQGKRCVIAQWAHNVLKTE